MTNSAKVNNPIADPASAPMLCLSGQGAAHGYAIGRAVVMGATALEVAHYRISRESVAAEQFRLSAALDTARQEMLELAESLPDDAPRELGALLNVHGMLLSDPLLADEALSLIQDKLYNAEWALTTQGQLLGEQFAAMEDEYLRERGADVRQVIERVLHVLGGSRPISSLDLVGQSAEPLVVVAHDISPADMIRLRGGRFAGFATDLGGPTSHTAIVARSMDVPAVVGLGEVRSLVRDGDVVVVDGVRGTVIVNPSALALEQYRALQKRYAEERLVLAQLKDVPAETQDGIVISLQANIELPDEAEIALANGATGIGLFRSEFLFIGRSELPTEEEQYQAYASVVKVMQPEDEQFSGVVFKVQANMDANHRDRIAFVRMASGKYTPGMKLKVQRTGKELRPTSVVTFLSQRREAVDEAYAGDIIGFTTHGGVQLGDTITDGANLLFTGLPFFAPELFMTVILKNPLRTKQLQQGLDQLGEEGAIQVFKPEVGGPMLLGAVGQLQFEVVQHRLKTEYDCDVRLEGCQYTGARWITADTPAELREFTNAYPQRMSLDAAGTLAYLCTSPYDVRLAQERFPKIHFHPLREHAGLALGSAG